MVEIMCIKQLDEHLWAIDEQQKVTLFIVNGSDRVLLIDTGSGLVDLKKEIRMLCGDKPITVINTHAHLDHTAGNYQFPAVYTGRFDEPESHLPEEVCRRGDEIAYFKEGLRDDQIKDWHPGPAEKILPLKEGDRIDFGDMCFDVIEIPSHTLGSIALFEPDLGWMFSGDIVLPWEAWAWLYNSATLKQYRESVARLCEMKGHIRRLFPSHGQEAAKVPGYSRFELPTEILDVYREGISGILEGNYRTEEFIYDGNVHGRDTGSIPKRKVSFRIGGIIFDPERLGV